MKLQPDDQEEPEINLTSLIDVVFLLLIFFMVSTTFERQALIRLDLPRASTAEVDSLPEVVELMITADGQLYADEQRLVDSRLPTVRAALAERFAANDQAVLVVRADAEAPHRLVVRVLDAAASEGISRVSIAAVEEDETR
ncbi:MAG: biopolymer transporter ExbD [Pseudomonadota bacterium]|nr:MAG: biopolymer transporter ExbD [Pseudomonadota bacterium]